MSDQKVHTHVEHNAKQQEIGRINNEENPPKEEIGLINNEKRD